MRYTLVEGQGNFGSMDDEPAASRYTGGEWTKLRRVAVRHRHETVDFVITLTKQRKSQALPSAVPNILLNGQMGIAVGMATNIPPHNLRGG